MKENLWDDEAFKERLAKAARRKGISVARALVEAGSSRFYVAKTKPVDGRSPNTILNLAKVLDVTPAWLFGIDPVEPKPKPEPELETPIVSQLLREAAATATANGDGDRHQRITMVARMVAAQLAALVCVACGNADSDPKALIEMVMQEINKDYPAGRGGKSQ